MGLTRENGRQFLDLRFRLFALGDVGETAGSAQNAAIIIQRQLGVNFHPAELAVLGEETGFIAAVIQLALDQLEKDVAVALAVIMVNKFRNKVPTASFTSKPVISVQAGIEGQSNGQIH